MTIHGHGHASLAPSSSVQEMICGAGSKVWRGFGVLCRGDLLSASIDPGLQASTVIDDPAGYTVV